MSRKTTTLSANGAQQQEMFQAGETFLNACRMLDDARKRGNRFILQAPMAVNSGLALELFLKCLRAIENGDFFPRHELDQLYWDLPRPIQDEIRRRHDEVQKSAKHGPFFAKLQADGFKTDLDSLLKMGAKTFEHFRYAFDPKIAAQKTTWALDDFMFIVRDIILEKHPKWTPTGYPPPRS